MSNLSDREVLPPSVTLLNHPVVEEAITRLRICPQGKTYTDLVDLVGNFLAAEATRDLSTDGWSVTTRLGDPAPGRKIRGRVGLVSITRGGNDLIPAFRRMLPTSSVYHVAARRKTEVIDGKKVVSAYLIDSKLPEKLPEEMETVIVLDPLFASGSSVELVLKLLQALKAKHIIFVCVMAAPEGMDLIVERFPEVRIIMAQLDEKLDENFYIRPGLGDGSDVGNATTHD